MPWRRRSKDDGKTGDPPPVASPSDHDAQEESDHPSSPPEPDLPPVPVYPIRQTEFAGAIARNGRNTIALCILLTAIGCILGVLIGGALGGGLSSGASSAPGGLSPDHPVIRAGLIGGAAMLTISAIAVLIALVRGDRIILRLAGGQKTETEDAPQLHNIVEEIAIAAGLPKPDVYVIDTPALNAFATGLRPENAAIGVTLGLLERLNRQELQAVVAHEMGHIANNDIRYATAVGMLVGVIALVCDAIIRSLFHGARVDTGSNRVNLALIALMLVVIALLAVLAPLAARLVQMAISRQREYMADATAVKFTRHPTGLINALQKIGASTVPYKGANRAIQHLFIANPARVSRDGAGALFSTHPSIRERIERLQNLG